MKATTVQREHGGFAGLVVRANGCFVEVETRDVEVPRSGQGSERVDVLLLTANDARELARGLAEAAGELETGGGR